MNHPASGLSLLITGGAGFIGCNLASAYLSQGQSVHVFDNLSRDGVQSNLDYLQATFGRLVRFTNGDITDRRAVEGAIEDASAIVHLAAQVAVTTSLVCPLHDLETNLIGTVNVIDAIRRSEHRPALVFTSTNKVYGKLDGVPLHKLGERWEPENVTLARSGADESQPLDFLSPYGCSKGSADQYVLDYVRSYGIPAAVFRMSCIYGPHQLGTEDQGWVAHFMRQMMRAEPITLYGDGMQVRDLLFVEDLIRAIQSALANMDSARGQAFNIGGGWENSISLLEVIRSLESMLGIRASVRWGAERLGDQKWYIADVRKMKRKLGWQPNVPIADGLARLLRWYESHPTLVAPAEVQVA